MLPIVELRGGLPLALHYSAENSFPVWISFSLVVLANILVILFIFLFLDFVHAKLVNMKVYRKTFNFFLRRTRKKVDKVEEKISVYGYLALTFFVAIPLPVTGAWTGCLIAWILDLDRKKSIPAIALGVLIAGILVMLAYYGIIGFIDIARS